MNYVIHPLHMQATSLNMCACSQQTEFSLWVNECNTLSMGIDLVHHLCECLGFIISFNVIMGSICYYVCNVLNIICLQSHI